MAQHLSNRQRDEIVNAAEKALDVNERVAFESGVEYLSDKISETPGGRGFGKTRARELIVSLACFLNAHEAA